ncbi:MAG: tetratricopeptide repeat protein, partial [Gemmatimonadaceae bacterium]
YEALWKTSRQNADLAEYEPDADKRKRMYATAEALARRAVAVNPGDAEAHFHLARALGRVALSLGVRDRIKYAGDVRTQALEALRLQPDHPGALHVLGVWNAEVMRLSGVSRWMARNFLGGSVFREASWENAERYLEKAVEVDPDRVVHSLDLAEVYLDRKQQDKAREQLQRVLDGRIVDYNDRHYKEKATRMLERLGTRSG